MLTETSRAALQRAIVATGGIGVDRDDLAILRDWVKAGEVRSLGVSLGLESPLALLSQGGFVEWVLAGYGVLEMVVQRARTWRVAKDEREKRGSELAEELKAAREKRAGV